MQSLIELMGWLILVPVSVGIFLIYLVYVDFIEWRGFKNMRKNLSLKEQFDIFGQSLFFLLFLIIFMLVLSQEATADENNTSSYCKDLQNLEAELNKKFPNQIDETTEMVQFSVNCDTTTVKYTKRILVDLNLFNEGWETRKQRQHTQLHCNAQGMASNSGWTAMDVIYDKDFEYIVTLTTEPKDCN